MYSIEFRPGKVSDQGRTYILVQNRIITYTNFNV